MDIGTGLSIFDLTRFLDANRSAPRDQVRGRLSLENALAKAASQIRSPPRLYSDLSSSVWSYDMVFRPRDLASRMAGRRKPDDGYLRETFTLSRDKARARARDFSTAIPRRPI